MSIVRAKQRFKSTTLPTIARQRGGEIWRGQVHHTTYPVQRARLLGLHDELIGAAGLPQPTTPPPLVHYVPGVNVEIFGIEPVDSSLVTR